MAVQLSQTFLEFVVKLPINVEYYENLGNVLKSAANLSKKISKYHAFQDGNKRNALVTVDMFLKVNGYRPQEMLPDQDFVNEDLAATHNAVYVNNWPFDDLAEFHNRIAAAIP